MTVTLFETANAQSCDFAAGIERIQLDQRSYIMNVGTMEVLICTQKSHIRDLGEKRLNITLFNPKPLKGL
jgi:hypothetical protein